MQRTEDYKEDLGKMIEQPVAQSTYAEEDERNINT
jgi:hypothetical protein